MRDIEEADDLEECPRDQTETVGEVLDDVDEAWTWYEVAMLSECRSERMKKTTTRTTPDNERWEVKAVDSFVCR